jgi:uncharacterized protein YjbK
LPILYHYPVAMGKFSSSEKRMEVELKVRLGKESYIKLFNLLTKVGILVSTDLQSNYFLDSKNELEQKRITFRLRRAIKTMPNKEQVTACTMTMKGKAKNGVSNHGIFEGISRVEELEHSISILDFEQIIANPSSVTSFKYDLVPLVLEELTSRDIIITGQFENKRSHFKWNDLDLELDETSYPFGTAYELECEHPQPTKVKQLLEDLFRENGIDFGYSKRSKFGNMKAKQII